MAKKPGRRKGRPGRHRRRRAGRGRALEKIKLAVSAGARWRGSFRRSQRPDPPFSWPR